MHWVIPDRTELHRTHTEPHRTAYLRYSNSFIIIIIIFIIIITRYYKSRVAIGTA